MPAVKPVGTVVRSSLPLSQTVNTVSFDGNTNMTLLANYFARFEMACFPSQTPETLWTNDLPTNWGDNTGNVAYYSMTNHVGSRIRIFAYASAISAGAELYVRLSGVQRISSAVTQPLIEGIVLSGIPFQAELPIPTDYLRLDVYSHGGSCTGVSAGFYILGGA